MYDELLLKDSPSQTSINFHEEEAAFASVTPCRCVFTRISILDAILNACYMPSNLMLLGFTSVFGVSELLNYYVLCYR